MLHQRAVDWSAFRMGAGLDLARGCHGLNWTPAFLQLFDLTKRSGCYRKDIAFCNPTKSQSIAGWSTNIKALQSLCCDKCCALLFKSAQSRTYKPRADIRAKWTWEHGVAKEQKQFCALCILVIWLVGHVGLCFPWTGYRMENGGGGGNERTREQAASSGAGSYTKQKKQWLFCMPTGCVG